MFSILLLLIFILCLIALIYYGIFGIIRKYKFKYGIYYKYKSVIVPTIIFFLIYCLSSYSMDQCQSSGCIANSVPLNFFILFVFSNLFKKIFVKQDRWIEKGISKVGDNLLLYSYDNETIKIENNTIDIWLKLKWDKRVYNAEHNKYEDYQLCHIIINCLKKSLVNKSITIYFTDGITYDYTAAELKCESEIEPDTVIEDYYKNFCNKLHITPAAGRINVLQSSLKVETV